MGDREQVIEYFEVQLKRLQEELARYEGGQHHTAARKSTGEPWRDTTAEQMDRLRQEVEHLAWEVEVLRRL
jgi:hypothetical protein